VKAHIHYEAAFQDYLQVVRFPYVAVDEAKRAAFRDAKLKSFDFIVYSNTGPNWLVDIKGRRFAARVGQRKPAWENWATQADLDGLIQWQQVFGPGFRALLIFAYLIETEDTPPPETMHTTRGRHYVFAGIPVDTYQLHARVRSPKWGTVTMPRKLFAQHIRPIADWL
jgi:hypothetical protein